MLEVTVVIAGAVIAFIAMQLWASSGRLKSDNETETLAPIGLLLSAHGGFAINILVLVPADRWMAVLRSMFVRCRAWGENCGRCAVVATVGNHPDSPNERHQVTGSAVGKKTVAGPY